MVGKIVIEDVRIGEQFFDTLSGNDVLLWG
jgi:hypothetical protein